MKMNRLSCFCDGCKDEGVCKEREGVRPADAEQVLYEIHSQTGDHEKAHKAMRLTGNSVTGKAKVGDLVGVFVPVIHRVGGNYERDSDLWGEGRYMVGQLAEDVGPTRNAGTKRRASSGAMVKLFLPEEISKELSYQFTSRVVCTKDGGVVEVGTCNCGKKHFTYVPVTLVRGGPWKIEDMVVEGEVDGSISDGEGQDDCENVVRGESSSGSDKGRVHGYTRVPQKRGLSALQKVYARRRGLVNFDPLQAQRIVLTLGIRQFMAQLDQQNIDKYYSPLTM